MVTKQILSYYERTLSRTSEQCPKSRPYLSEESAFRSDRVAHRTLLCKIIDERSSQEKNIAAFRFFSGPTISFQKLSRPKTTVRAKGNSYPYRDAIRTHQAKLLSCWLGGCMRT